jgi:pilus assembly protein CpaB
MGGSGRLRRASDGARRSGIRAAAFWGVAIIAGLGAALLITKYLERRTVTVSTPTAKIVVAATDLPMASRIRAEQVRLTDWPISGIPPGALRDVREAVDRSLTSRVFEGEPILPGKLAAKDVGSGITALLSMNMRAMAVRVDDVIGVAGFIHPDDRVDVIVVMHPTKPEGAEAVAKVILQNVKVLSVGKELEVSESKRSTATSSTSATLMVNPEEAEKLALAANEGRITLTLRSWIDDDAIHTDGATPSRILSETNPKPREAVQVVAQHRASRRESAPVAAAPPPVTAPPVAARERESVQVEIIRGNDRTTSKFEAKDKQP